MQYVYADPSISWDEWDNGHSVDDDTRLIALREYLYNLATVWRASGEISADWANKKLTKLGVTERISVEHRYQIGVDITGRLDATFYATSRVEALEKLNDLCDGVRGASVHAVAAVGAPVFTFGPEDADPEAVDPDAPSTVDATLTMLREIILLGVVAGPKYCEGGANKVLADFGLDPVPARKRFVVTRPVEAVMSTVVEAYDEVSADRVAGWRWENDRTAYQLTGGEPTGDASVAGN